MRSAVLFLVFNRPETTRQVFEAIRSARPPRLYVAADGPRPSRQGELERCAEVRRIATDVDWPCEVKTLFQAANQGCGRGVVQGIDWFFAHEEEGIILEDDILPLPGFFTYCDELLERYRHDERVGLICGCNPVASRFTPAESYFFSCISQIWGWASWRRAWSHFDFAMSSWPEWRCAGGLKEISNGNVAFERYWSELFDETYSGKIGTAWDYQWTFACWRQGMLAALPARNQINNLGFGPGATHTVAEELPAFLRESVPQPLTFPLRHPDSVTRSLAADREIFARAYRPPLLNVWVKRAKKFAWMRSLIRIVKQALGKAR